MAQVKVNVDLDPALVKRLDAYIDVLASDPRITALHPGKVTRSTVLRHVMAEGLAALDERYGKRSTDCPQSKKQGKSRAKQ